jgi:hypothetical protein
MSFGKLGAMGRGMGHLGSLGAVKAPRSFHLGVDSLTEGSNLTTFRPYSTRMFSDLGDAKVSSLIVSAQGGGATNDRGFTQPYVTQSSSGADLTIVNTAQTTTSSPRTYSCDGFGVRTATGVLGNNNQISFACNRAWVKAELFYYWTSVIAGTAKVRSGDSATAIDLSTQDTTNRIVRSTINTNTGGQKVTVFPDLNATNPYTLTVDSMTGYFAVWAVKFYFDQANKGVQLWNSGIGGQSLLQYSGLDQSLRPQWIAALGLTDAILIVGMNDGSNYADSAAFKPPLKALIQTYIDGLVSPSRIIICDPIQSSTDITGKFNQAYIDACAETGATYLDLRALAGEQLLGLGAGHRATYAEMTSPTNYMFNTIHPNTTFNNFLADYFVSRFGL